MSMTPVENLLLPSETMTMRPGTPSPHLRPASLPATKQRVVLIGKYAYIVIHITV